MATDPKARSIAPDNEEIARELERVADLLEVQHANPHRIRAYRRAAGEIEQLPESVAALAENSDHPLEDLPGIGQSIAGLIREFVHTGRSRLRERLEGEVSPEDLFCTLPGVGEELAHRIHDTLHVETLEELEVAAHDGRLATVPGVGERRVHAIRADLEEILRQSTRQRARQRRLREAGHDLPDEHPLDTPPVRLLLEVDADYREGAAAGKLRRIAPRRFNPTGEAWLPILHTERDGWSFTALFSNTARAHDLGKTNDWVVLFHEREGHEDQCTVVTETRGKLKGRRVVRGREEECLRLARDKGGAS